MPTKKKDARCQRAHKHVIPVNPEACAPFQLWRRQWRQAGKPPWTSLVMPKLRRWLQTHVAGAAYDVELSGPRGICSEVRVEFIPRSSRRRSRYATLLLHNLSGQAGRGPLFAARRYDWPQSAEFGPTSLGALNGMNFPREVPPVNNPSAAWFAGLLH